MGDGKVAHVLFNARRHGWARQEAIDGNGRTLGAFGQGSGQGDLTALADAIGRHVRQTPYTGFRTHKQQATVVVALEHARQSAHPTRY